MGGNHNINRITTYIFSTKNDKIDHKRDFLSNGDINIGNDVWIGDGATILSGVTIGTGAVIGAYSVVSKDVEPYSIVVGNPARVVKKRFSEDQIKILLESEWWNWDIVEIAKCHEIIFGENFDKFKKILEER